MSCLEIKRNNIIHFQVLRRSYDSVQCIVVVGCIERHGGGDGLEGSLTLQENVCIISPGPWEGFYHCATLEYLIEAAASWSLTALTDVSMIRYLSQNYVFV